jgi:hypothetical protein
MADVLAEHEGLELTDDPAQADVLLLNTCSIREKAQEKVFSQLGRWKAGRTTEVVAEVPNVILTRATASHGLGAAEIRAAAAETFAESIPRAWKLRGAQSIGSGFVLVLYDATIGEAGSDDETETRVAVAVHEGSAWKVFP